MKEPKRYIVDELHIAGYYRGLLHHSGILKEVLKRSSQFIDKLK